jgi:lipopolysaccharide/colanic/teichoic acid biosynthesis glycosyltransferase
MNKPNFGRELKETTKDFSLWTISTLLEGLFIALWIFIQWVVNNKIIAPLKLNSVEQMIVLIFQIIFAINLIAQVLIMIYRNIRILLVRTNYTISAETNNEINSNEFKIEDKKHIKNKLTRTFQLFFPSLGAFIVSVLTGIAILLLIIFLSNNKSFEYAHILFYLILPEFLVLYCIFTTKTSNTSFNFLGQQIIKRLFDVIVSVLILFFMLPVILLISVVIKLDSHGPIIYSSKRIGQFGVPFDRYIFRTIYADNKITYIVVSGEN